PVRVTHKLGCGRQSTLGTAWTLWTAAHHLYSAAAVRHVHHVHSSGAAEVLKTCRWNGRYQSVPITPTKNLSRG
ncbi:MAG TPA: hypothetical protein PKY10_15735, partial [Lentisphaeria bacterium]|nr:hypothetical protein [Lentisphaeria bacterium]